jgi:NADPH:quinone reductase-like Zn-dependent oxidoreductase
MKSCWIRSESGKTSFEFRDVPVPQPKPGEILVRTRAASMNRGELLASIGWHGLDQPKPAGRDLSGEVHAVGEGVTAFRPGDRIMARAHGSFSEYVAVSQDLVMPAPAHLSWEQAAAVPIAFVTAHVSLYTYGRVKAGEWVLIAGASSGVGVASIQAAKYAGAKVIGTSGSADKLEKLKAIGLDAGILARGNDFGSQVMEATGGKGANLALDLVGGSMFPGCLASLANQGRLVIVGYVDGVMKSEIDLETVHGRRIEIAGVSNAFLTPAERAEGTRTFVRDLMPAFSEGRIAPVIDRVFSFDELPAAKAYVEKNAHVGKVVVRIS